MNRKQQIQARIAEIEVILSPLRSELATLQNELRSLERSEAGITIGSRVVSDNGEQEFILTRVRKMGEIDGKPAYHLYGKRVLKNGETSKHPKYFGIFGFGWRVQA